MPDHEAEPFAPRPMKGGGHYEQHARTQMLAAERAVRALERAASSVPLAQDSPCVLVDYGAATGRNSLPAVRAVRQVLDGRGAAELLVYHCDLPDNDFSAL